MIHVKLRQVEPATGGCDAVYEPVEPAGSHCGGCGGCNEGRARIHLSGFTASELSLQMSMRTQLWLLWNSWLKPLSAMLVAAIVCRSAAISEFYSLLTVFSVFSLGILTCRPATRDRHTILTRGTSA